MAGLAPGAENARNPAGAVSALPKLTITTISPAAGMFWFRAARAGRKRPRRVLPRGVLPFAEADRHAALSWAASIGSAHSGACGEEAKSQLDAGMSGRRLSHLPAVG